MTQTQTFAVPRAVVPPGGPSAPAAPAAAGRHVAIDTHRTSRFLVVATPQGEELLRRKLGVSPAATTDLLAYVQPGDWVILEATTGAHALAPRLESRGARVFVVDPQRTRLVGFRGKKTDYRDCRALLEHLRKGDLALVWRPDPETRNLRQLTRERFALNQAITRLKNRIRSLWADEGREPPGDLWSPAGAAWMEAQALPPGLRRILDRELRALAALTELKEEQKQDLAQFALGLPVAQRLMQLPGFGVDLATMWVGEVGDVHRFPTAKHLVSYAGLNPQVDQSGNRSKAGLPISKAGRTQLRWIMVEVAQRHVAADGPEAGYYHHLVQRGKLPQVAMVALARRLLERAYQLVRRPDTHRAVDLEKYARKLTDLAAQRPPRPEPEPCNADWAADRVEALTGRPAPRRVAGMARQCRRVRKPASAGAPGSAPGPVHGKRGSRRDHPDAARGERDPSGSPPRAADGGLPPEPRREAPSGARVRE